MTRRELGTLMKTAAAKSWRAHELHLLIKAAAFKVERKQGLKDFLKNACDSLEKSAAFRLNPGAGRAFKVRAGTQNTLRNMVNTRTTPAPRPARRPGMLRRAIGNRADTGRLYGEGTGFRRWRDTITGRNLDNFFNRAEIDGRALTRAEKAQYVNRGRDLYAKNTKSLPAVRDRATLVGAESGMFQPKTWIQQQQLDNAFSREAARLRGNTIRARSNLGLAAAVPMMAGIGIGLS